MGRFLCLAGAALLLATAVVHALGQPMVAAWVAGLAPVQRAGIALVWLTDSLSWVVVAALWAIAGWTGRSGWLGAALLASLVPAVTAIALLWIDLRFFGGWMLVASLLLAGSSLAVIRRSAA